ncbi:MAG: hypothetical protein CL666_01690 [Balneola sp.]|nr:hypothetical protein [Balneola sp.]|tara:strand:+ start:51550 stop:51780 length:231 start_codon:yes stop_codon:yes gene_type:complete
MNAIRNLFPQQQVTQLNQPSSLRQAAEAPAMPGLTQDESSLIEEKFTENKTLDFYSVDGSFNQEQLRRGMNIDTRI